MTDNATPPQSFAEFFAAEIAPGLPALEAQRRDRLRNAYTRIFGVAFVVVVAALIAWLAWHLVAGAMLLIGGALLGLPWARQPAERHRSAVCDLVIPPLLRFLGRGENSVEYLREPNGRFDLERVKRSGITGAFNRAKLEDLFQGRYRDTDFRMVEARLRRKRRRSRRAGQRTHTVFSGLLCDISVPIAFSSAVLLVGDKGAVGNWVVNLLKRSFEGIEPVALGDPAFEAHYQVYSDNPAEVQRLLQPGLLETLLALSDELDRKAVNCAFLEGRFLMAIPQRRDLFEIGLLQRSLEHAEDDLRRLAEEFTIAHRLIDNLHGERKPLLPES